MDRNKPQFCSKMVFSLRWFAGLQIIFSLGLILSWLTIGESGWILGVGCLFLILSAFWTGIFLPKLLDGELRKREEANRKEAIRILSNYRHDVMNHVQLIKGYMQLQKYERLQGPIQQLVSDANRHSALSNLPGTELSYSLIQRDLSTPMLRLLVQIEDAAENWNHDYEQKLLDMLMELAEAGESLSQELGIPVEWIIKVRKQEGRIAITLHVLGEHVNGTYIDEVIEEFGHMGWTLQERVQDGQDFILSFGSWVKS